MTVHPEADIASRGTGIKRDRPVGRAGGVINKNPTVVMLAPGFQRMSGRVLIVDGCGVQAPKGCIYAAMAFPAGVEALNMWSRTRSVKRSKASEETRYQGHGDS
jgi:hypothetical protein